ncbi:MAG: hypothetical protein ACRYFX_07525 [Janthinobacterium lividum]
MRLILLAGLLLAATAANAQATSTVYPIEVWPEAQGELALRNGDYLLLVLHAERTVQSNDYAYQPLGFGMRRALLGYEHFATPQWSFGGTLRLEGYGNGYNVFAPEALLRHRSPVFKGFTFGQRLSLEYRTGYFPGSYGLLASDGQVWTRLRLDLEKLFPLGPDASAVALRPRLSAEASTHVRLQKADGDLKERFIQFASLRAEVGVRVSPRFDLTPWFAYQTDYLQYLEQYDLKGNLVDNGKYNRVVPTVGLDLRFTILSTGSRANRVVLPTQH